MADARGDGGDERALMAGDPGFTEALRGSIRAVVRTFRFPGEIREDLVQDVLERVFQNVTSGRFRGDATLKTYAQSIARYACLERRRRGRHEAALARAGDAVRASPGPEEGLIRRESIERDLHALRNLPEPCRVLLRMIFVERLSYQQVADRLGVKEGTVKSRVHRCRLEHLSGQGEKCGAWEDRPDAGVPAPRRRRAGTKPRGG